MIPVLIEATLRSLIPASVVNDFQKFRMRVGFGRKRAFVHQHSIAFSRLPLTEHRVPEADACSPLSSHPKTLLEELQSILVAKAASEFELRAIEAHVAAAIPARTEEPALTAHKNCA